MPVISDNSTNESPSTRRLRSSLRISMVVFNVAPFCYTCTQKIVGAEYLVKHISLHVAKICALRRVCIHATTEQG